VEVVYAAFLVNGVFGEDAGADKEFEDREEGPVKLSNIREC